VIRTSRQLGDRQLGRLAEPGDRRDRLGAGPPAALLRPAEQRRRELRAAAMDQRPDPLGPVDLVGAEAQQVDVQPADVERQLAERLDRVAVDHHRGVGRARRRAQRRNIIGVAQLMVGGGQRHQTDLRVGRQSLGERARIDAPTTIYCEEDQRVTLAGQRLRGREHRRMFEGRGQHTARASCGPQRPCSAEDRQVVGLGPAAREGHLERLRRDGAGDRSPGLLDHRPRALPGSRGRSTGWPADRRRTKLR
jgi:hypothetical protein